MKHSNINIFHTLAERALEGTFLLHNRGLWEFDIDGPSAWFTHIQHCKPSESMKDEEGFYGLNADEQCLFLLFCGESYESA